MNDKNNSSHKTPALFYHRYPKPGKLEVNPTKPLASSRDLARAYSPGVAEACHAIVEDADAAKHYTVKNNLVAVVTNGSAVLGLGNIGPLAAKPVMEGKAVLFKKFADIDCFDIEVDEADPEKLAELIIKLAPTFGAINLEDIKAPDCFAVEKICRSRMNIPVFHDDQHGTAIVVGAALTNALYCSKKNFGEIKVVSTGGGAAGIACLNMLLKLGVKRENVWLCDLAGLVYNGRTEDMTHEKAFFAQGNQPMSLEDVLCDADLFLGLSGPGVLKPEWIKKMASPPIIFALANPTPEILPEQVKAESPDAIIATGRSDYPNQVNNVLCFPFIFRGALDVSATEINDEMTVSCVKAIAELARRSSSAEAAEAYDNETLRFGPDYLIPKPFDPRLLSVVASAVAEAAIRSGVAKDTEIDIIEYRENLERKSHRTALIMRPVFQLSKKQERRVIFAEGEDERVLRTAQAMLEEGISKPILIGRPDVVAARCNKLGLELNPSTDLELIDPNQDERYWDYWNTYLNKMQRQGVTPDLAKAIMRTNTTAIAAVAVELGDADSLICGTFGQYLWHLNYISQILSDDEHEPLGALSLMLIEPDALFIADTQMFAEPNAELLVNIAKASAQQVRRFGLEPKIAFCSQSQFGNLDSKASKTLRAAIKLLDQGDNNFIYEGEMTTEAALNPSLRTRIFPDSRLQDDKANILIYASSDTASSVRDTLKTSGGGLEVGPMLMGMGNRAHVVTPSITARGLLNISALASTPSN